MKIYTKTGDTGDTGLIGGTRVPKSDLRIEAYGTIDELNSYLGLLRDQEVNQSRLGVFQEIQDRLFTIGSSLACDPEKPNKILPDLRESDILKLEKYIDQFTAQLEPLRNFILPGGHPSISIGHVCRSVCRRAERNCVALHKVSPLDPMLLQYLNRLSDFLFTLCRWMHKELDVPEIAWKPRN